MALGPERPAPLAVQVLGGFRVRRHGEALPAVEWRSKKARDLLKLLVARRGHPTSRDYLMEALWPEEDPEKTTNRLSVALSTIRSTLDPERDFSPDHYVVMGKDGVRLDATHLEVDVDAFVAAAETGLNLWRDGRRDEAAPVLASAEEAYGGDFLEEDRYEDWAAPLREQTRTVYVAVLTALAEHSLASADYDAAIRYRLRVLERDAYDEAAHLALVSVLTAAGRHGEARRAYQAYAARMEELDIEPTPFPRAPVAA
jgi:DNA-binding SARP family transcriptional activator